MTTSEDRDPAALGARLRAAREYRGFSQQEVASHLGISRSAVSLIEKGARRITIFELRKLAQLYECTIDELMEEKPSARTESDSIQMVARAAASLSPEDRSEVLRFAQFLETRKSRKSE